jgi:hypothetical protein
MHPKDCSLCAKIKIKAHGADVRRVTKKIRLVNLRCNEQKIRTSYC